MSRTLADRIPPPAYFVTAAVFHYLGPSFAVLLFAAISPPGVAWLRIAVAALVFAAWRRPWRYAASLSPSDRARVLALGCVLAGMNIVFYLAIDRLPLGTVGAIEFLGPIGLAAAGARTPRNLAASAIALAGGALLASFSSHGQALGFLLALANCGLFVLYVMLSHRISGPGGLDRLGAAMLVAAAVALPFGIRDAAPAFLDWRLLAAAIAVGVTSSVIPYVCDQQAMARLPRATFALMLAILPAVATVMGLVVLHQKPTLTDLAGIGLIVAAVALHRPKAAPAEVAGRES
jgi:inner membrane transporter RhtA